MSDERDAEQLEATARTAFGWLASAAEVAGRRLLGAHPDARPMFDEYGRRLSNTELGSMFQRLACSFALAARSGGDAVTSVDAALAAFYDGVAMGSSDARASMSEILLTRDELARFNGLDSEVLRSVAFELFEYDIGRWCTLAPRAFHRAIMRLIYAPIQVGARHGFVRIARKNDPTASTDAAAEHVVDATFGAALREESSTGERASYFIFDPRCRSGTFLLAALRVLRRELASRPREASLVDAALRGFVRERLRGTDASPTSVALARLGLWLETGEVFTSADLRRVVVLDADVGTVARPPDAKTFVFSDGSAYGPNESLAPIVRTARVGDSVGALIDVALATSPAGEPARAEWDCDFSTARPLIEPRLRSALERPRTLALVAQRRSRMSGEFSESWAHHPYGVDALDRRLLLALSVEPTIATIAASSARSSDIKRSRKAWPRVWVDKSEPVLEGRLVANASTDDPMLFLATAAGWDGFALFALLRSTVVRWQRAMLAASRGADSHTVQDVLELAVPRYCDPASLRAAGVQLASARSEQELRTAIDAVDAAASFGGGLDGGSQRMLAGWSARRPLPSALIVDEVPSLLGDPPARAATAPAAPAPGAKGPLAVSAHNEGAPSVRPTKSNGALGQGSESMLRNRADDGRSAVIPGRKRVTAQPEGDAEREAWAILRAAGSDGLTLGALVRRAREHDEDEIREAIAGLANSAWIELSVDGAPVPASAVFTDDLRLRALSR